MTTARRILILSFFVPLLMVACGKSNKVSNETPLLRSYRLIDENRTDDAINYLTSQIDERDAVAPSGQDDSPDTTRLRVALASAYGKKAGVDVHAMAKAFQAGKSIASVKAVKFDKIDEAKASNQDHQLEALAVWIVESLKGVEVVEVIPKIEADKIMYLQQAIRILNSTPKLLPGDLVYSALLKVIYVRAEFEVSELKTVLPTVHQENGQCIAKVSDFRDYLVRASKLLLSAYDDLGNAMPTKKAQFQKDSQVIVDLTTSIASVTAATDILDTVSLDTMNRIYKSLGLASQNISCGANESPAP